ncbi:Bifunctional pinoresinol-lariciresinol reductase 2 [Lasiodiplodia theobromae]|uniref:Bifunctional pinoresinol-lariciresinol reductase 2 n=1 Tax=Lasiodiplodia theobromae TaxID=45133 RepID=A0A5N5CXQ3_9PEZI|nr:Bifunctional pinoresinol-lariciresinol reductase 2 [Lasiodiplodia theobromae]
MKVAVAGGNTSVGLAIVDGIKARGKYECIILGRRPHAEHDVLVVDYADIDGLVAKLEETQVNVVISALSMQDDACGQAQLNLIEAANRSKCTKRFLPSEFGIHYTAERVENLTGLSFHYKLTAVKALEKTDLEFSLVSCGIYLDYWAASVIPSRLRFCQPYWLDFGHRLAAIPGDGNAPLVLTHTRDVGRFTAALLELPRWERRYTIRGDRLALNEAVRTAEEVMGVKFAVVYESAEKLREEDATILPGMGGLLDEATRTVMKQRLAHLGIICLEGCMDLDGSASLNVIFPDIKPLTVWDVAEAWKEKLQ